MFIAKISKDHIHLVDSKIAKIARILISSVIFGLLHYTSPSELANVNELQLCFYGNRMINSFITGLVYGLLQEQTGNIAFSILAHTLNNSLAVGSMNALGRTAG